MMDTVVHIYIYCVSCATNQSILAALGSTKFQQIRSFQVTYLFGLSFSSLAIPDHQVKPEGSCSLLKTGGHNLYQSCIFFPNQIRPVFLAPNLVANTVRDNLKSLPPDE
jgi:hypothetical protein